MPWSSEELDYWYNVGTLSLFELYQRWPHLGNMSDSMLRRKLLDPLAETPWWAYAEVLRLRSDQSQHGSEVE